MGQILIPDIWTQGLIGCVAGWTQASMLSLLLLNALANNTAEIAAKKREYTNNLSQVTCGVTFHSKVGKTAQEMGPTGVRKELEKRNDSPNAHRFDQKAGLTRVESPRRGVGYQESKDGLYLRENILPQTITEQTAECPSHNRGRPSCRGSAGSVLVNYSSNPDT